jgi:hypothetical protein
MSSTPLKLLSQAYLELHACTVDDRRVVDQTTEAGTIVRWDAIQHGEGRALLRPMTSRFGIACCVDPSTSDRCTGCPFSRHEETQTVEERVAIVRQRHDDSRKGGDGGRGGWHEAEASATRRGAALIERQMRWQLLNLRLSVLTVRRAARYDVSGNHPARQPCHHRACERRRGCGGWLAEWCTSLAQHLAWSASSCQSTLRPPAPASQWQHSWLACMPVEHQQDIDALV